MKKEEIIGRYGEEAYEKMRKQASLWWRDNSEKAREHSRKNHEEHDRKGGKFYLKTRRYNSIGIRRDRNRIRSKHAGKWQQYKKVIAPESQCHHEWITGTAKYRGVALVEKDPHQYGIINVIQILDGKITIFTEGKSKSIYIG